MTVVQPLERTRNVDVEVKVVAVLGLVDSLEVANDIFMDVCSEWFGGLDLVVGGCVEAKDPNGSCDNLTNNWRRGQCGGEREIREAIIVTHVRFFYWVDLERSKAGANIRWSDPFLASDGGTGIGCR